MTDKTEWEKDAANILKAELTRRGMGYEELKHALEKVGVKKSTNSINVAINRGKFSFAFFLQCAKAIGIQKVQFD